MTQIWLSHCMILNAHKEALGKLSLIETANKVLQEKWSEIKHILKI